MALSRSGSLFGDGENYASKVERVDTSAIFKAYDVRGTYPDQLNEDVARAVGSAFATFAGASTILMARDMRPSGPSLSQAFAEGARAVGVR